MNFYNPYLYSIPTGYVQPKIGLLGRLFGSTGVSIGNFINGTQRVLNIANQAIPLVKQVKPIVGNAKTMFKVMNEFKKTEKQIINNQNIENKDEEKLEIIKEEKIVNENGPTFFI